MVGGKMRESRYPATRRRERPLERRVKEERKFLWLWACTTRNTHPEDDRRFVYSWAKREMEFLNARGRSSMQPMELPPLTLGSRRVEVKRRTRPEGRTSVACDGLICSPSRESLRSRTRSLQAIPCGCRLACRNCRPCEGLAGAQQRPIRERMVYLQRRRWRRRRRHASRRHLAAS